ncbi:MAG TPA: helix-turn-helix domain-containing protein [Bacteroidota bacterium]|nr:helix-turn-helix domain-containing protein [Bacteroidota bacterium]
MAVSKPRESPYRIVLSPEERSELVRRAMKYTSPYYHILRAKMILLAAEGFSTDEIATLLDIRREIVWKWRKRFFEQRLAGLEEHPRPGRPRVFPPGVRRPRQGPGV